MTHFRYRAGLVRHAALCLLCLGLAAACSSASGKGKDAAGGQADVAADTEFLELAPIGTDDVVSADDTQDIASPEEILAPDLDALLDAAMPDPVDGCTPKCDGKACGPDGCGSVCGYCISGQVCTPDGKQCKTYCEPDCTKKGKKCGDNGCGGSCGDCGGGFHCGIDYLCYKDDCIGSCDGKVCGDDGCGLSCGVCATGDLCDATGKCKAGPCKGIPKVGSCSGDILTVCIGEVPNQQKQVTDCGAVGTNTCGYDAGKGTNTCVAKPMCMPKCLNSDGTKKLCGPDECGNGGQCGTCPNGWSCPGGTCVPEVGADCGAFSAAGKCVGDTWMWCNTGKISAINCADSGMKCAWDGAKFGCQ